MGKIVVRVDDRLIHGQTIVALSLIHIFGAGRLKLSKVSVLNDQSVQLTMRMHPASAVNRQNLPVFQKMYTAISLLVA